MGFVITGDIHGTYDIGKVVSFYEGREEEYSKDDYLILCGDVGVCGFSAYEEAQTRNILTHTGPREIAAAMGYGELSDGEVALRQYLQRVADNTEFTAWYFGHFHEDTEVEEGDYA